MHLLIDQSRKGSAPPTLRLPLPSVNHSRNNLMIGALVLLSRLPRRSPSTVHVGDYYDAALWEIFFLFSRPASPFLLPTICLNDEEDDGHLCPIYTEEGFDFYVFENTRLSHNWASTSIPYEEWLVRMNRERSSFTITRPNEKRIASSYTYLRIISFECRLAATSIASSQCTTDEYFRRNSRDKSRTNVNPHIFRWQEIHLENRKKV